MIERTAGDARWRLWIAALMRASRYCGLAALMPRRRYRPEPADRPTERGGARWLRPCSGRRLRADLQHLFAVQHEIETLPLLVRGHPQADDQVDDLQQDQAADAAV